jgi:hypothetical protein
VPIDRGGTTHDDGFREHDYLSGARTPAPALAVAVGGTRVGWRRPMGLSSSVAMSEQRGAAAGSGRGGRRFLVGARWPGRLMGGVTSKKKEGHQRSFATRCGDGPNVDG